MKRFDISTQPESPKWKYRFKCTHCKTHYNSDFYKEKLVKEKICPHCEAKLYGWSKKWWKKQV